MTYDSEPGKSRLSFFRAPRLPVGEQPQFSRTVRTAARRS
jgi:hypothetical protein